MCNINGLKDHSIRHQMDVSDQCKTYRKSQGLPLRTFAFRIPLKRRGSNLSEFGVRMSQLSPGLLMSVHRTIQTHGPNPATLPFAEAANVAPCVQAELCRLSELTQAGPRRFTSLRVAAGRTSSRHHRPASSQDRTRRRLDGRKTTSGPAQGCPGLSR